MGYYNVPDDWGCYYTSCSHCGTRYHMSEGGCDCPQGYIANSNRPWLQDSDYEWSDGCWEKLISSRVRTARKAHLNGKIQPGQRYRVNTYRCIDDETGESSHHTYKHLIR